VRGVIGSTAGPRDAPRTNAHHETTKLMIIFHGLSLYSHCIATVIRIGWIDTFSLDPD
jgi:hypothetical protein